jgi:hypothetical protein
MGEHVGDAAAGGRPHRRFGRVVLAAILVATIAIAAACAPPPPPPPPPPPTNPLSLGVASTVGNDAAVAASISSNGDIVAFTSRASNLVPNDTNGFTDLFVRQVTTGTVTRIAEQVNSEPRISANGRYVSYRATGGQLAVFDRTTATTTSWSPAAIGFGPITPIVPDDGTVAITGVASSFGITGTDCRVRTLATGVEQTCPAGGPGFGQVAYEAASPNGRYVLYFWLDQSGGGTSGRLLWDRTLGTTTAVPATVGFFPTFAVLANDGTIVFTQVLATGFGTLAAYDIADATLTLMPGPIPNDTSVPTGVAANGTAVTFVSQASNLVSNDTNGVADTFRWDLAAGTVARTSVAIGTAAELPNGATRCGSAPGQTTSTGAQQCGLTPDPAAPIDTNGVADAYRFN